MCHHYDLEQLTTTAESSEDQDDVEFEVEAELREETPVADD